LVVKKRRERERERERERGGVICFGPFHCPLKVDRYALIVTISTETQAVHGGLSIIVWRRSVLVNVIKLANKHCEPDKQQ